MGEYKGKNYGYKGLYKTPTYSSWNAMKQRCDNPNTPEYEIYGGIGISYDSRWKEFKNFVEDMGIRPNGKTLDRINPYGDYSKDNCRWATKLEQQQNLKCQQNKHHGVRWREDKRKFEARVNFNNKVYTKHFTDINIADQWRKETLEKLWETI